MCKLMHCPTHCKGAHGHSLRSCQMTVTVSVFQLMVLPGMRHAPLRIASAMNFPPEPPIVPMMRGAVKLPGNILAAASHRAVMVPTLRMLEHACTKQLLATLNRV